jgi:hypothetical protein
MSQLECVESRNLGGVEQTSGEEIPYTVTTTNWGSSPSSTAVVAYDEVDKDDVTSTVFPTNSPTESGDVITLSLLKALTAGHTYRVEVLFTSGSTKFECYFRVKCVDF